MMENQAVLITGASTGIGRACALEFDRLGMAVFATVRKIEDADELRAESSDRLVPLIMDVTDERQIAEAADEVTKRIDESGGDLKLAGLVNNAGIAVSGPMELLPIDELRRQLEVNVIGQIVVTQAFLPHLIASGRGRIVNISSSSGLIASPFLGPYSASKFALEALSDSMRLELVGSNVRVSLIEPGPIETPIWEKSAESEAALEERIRQEVDEVRMQRYDEPLECFKKMGGRAAQRAKPVGHVVRDVVHAIRAKRPKTRYTIPRSDRFFLRLLALLPDRLRDWLVIKEMGMAKYLKKVKSEMRS